MFKYNKNGEFAKPKMNTKQKLHTTVSMLALTLIALTTATYAWFTLAASTRVNQLDLEVSAGAKLKIATRNRGNDVEDYYDEVFGSNGNYTDDDIDKWLQAEHHIALDRLLLCPLTSGNGEDFYTQAGNQSGTKTTNPNQASGSFMEYELYLIAESDMRVHLSTDDDGDGVWTHISSNESGLSNSASQQNIVECVRMSFYSTDEDGRERVLVWAPDNCDSDTTLKSHAAGDKIPFTGLSPHNSMNYTEDTWVCELKADEPKLVTVRVWIEGEDPDCIDDVQRAKFRTWLRFQGTGSDNTPIS